MWKMMALGTNVSTILRNGWIRNQLKFNSNWTLKHWFFFLFFLYENKSRFYSYVSNPDFLQTPDTKTFLYNTRKTIAALKNSARRFKRWLHSSVNAIHIEAFGTRSKVIIDKLLFAVGDEICVCVVFLSLSKKLWHLHSSQSRCVCVVHFNWNITNVYRTCFACCFYSVLIAQKTKSNMHRDAKEEK